MQKIKALLIASIIFTGCTSYHHSKCSAYANCDEFYPYSCEDSVKFVAYTPREYKKYMRRNWDYTGYYPNTQTIYYVYPQVTHEVTPPPTDNRVIRQPRPTNLGEWRGGGATRSSRGQRN